MLIAIEVLNNRFCANLRKIRDLTDVNHIYYLEQEKAEELVKKLRSDNDELSAAIKILAEFN